MTQSTIYALSTVFGKSGVAVIRLSGPQSLSAVKTLTGLNPQPRYAHFARIMDPITQEPIDHALVLYFPAPNSFTGEDIAEFQVHGSKAVISSLLSALSRLPGLRLAEPGEFSKRAFYNGKMDLTEAEGLADLIDAETSAQQKFALRQMEGGLKDLYENWRESLLQVLAHLEAYIDFPEEDIPQHITENILNNVFKLSQQISTHLQSDQIGERLRDGFRVVIAGAPNAGKSSLLNALANREAVIVSDIAGTTRDAIDIHLDLGGYPVIITDTAGLRDTGEKIEQQGIAMAYRKIEDADLVICLFDAVTDSVQSFEKIQQSFPDKVLMVANKSDCLSADQQKDLTKNNCLIISAKHRQGLSELLKSIKEIIGNRFASNSNLLITRQRYREALQQTVQNLNNFNFDKEIELSCEDLRLAARELGKITGRIEVDEILDKIFGSFCIGK